MVDIITDLRKEIAFRKTAFDTKQEKLRRELHDLGTTDSDVQERYARMFSEGIKDGSVCVEPHKDGTVSVIVNTVIEGKNQINEIPFDNKDEAAFLYGLQTTLKPPEESK